MDASEPDFVRVDYQQLRDTGADLSCVMWFERTNLRWVVDTLRSCLTSYAFPETTTRGGEDSLKIFESGPEQAPVINVCNVRPDRVVHGGAYARSMSKRVAKMLLEELARIV